MNVFKSYIYPSSNWLTDIIQTFHEDNGDIGFDVTDITDGHCSTPDYIPDDNDSEMTTFLTSTGLPHMINVMDGSSNGLDYLHSPFSDNVKQVDPMNNGDTVSAREVVAAYIDGNTDFFKELEASYLEIDNFYRDLHQSVPKPAQVVINMRYYMAHADLDENLDGFLDEVASTIVARYVPDLTVDVLLPDESKPMPFKDALLALASNDEPNKKPPSPSKANLTM